MMARLNQKECLSGWHLALMVVSTSIGSQVILAPAQLITEAGHGAWLSVLLGGAVYFFLAYLILKLAARYPGETLVSYIPRLWGKAAGAIFIVIYALIFITQLILILRGFSRAISYTMFTRTPEEAVALLFLAACVYAALQDWGTIVRIQQIVLFLAVPLLIFFFLVSLLNFHLDFLLPLRPENVAGLLKGIVISWNFYGGFEIILLIYPLICRRGVSKVKTVALGFAFMTAFFVMIIILTIGVLTVKTAGSLTYPTLVMIKGVEIPGTFVERLEIYMLLFWIPVVFDSVIVFLAAPAFILAEYFPRRPDHRLWVIALLPLLLGAAKVLDKIDAISKASEYFTLSGLIFPAVIVPLTLALSVLKEPAGGSDADAGPPKT